MFHANARVRLLLADLMVDKEFLNELTEAYRKGASSSRRRGLATFQFH
jgi:hypothetical protein